MKASNSRRSQTRLGAWMCLVLSAVVGANACSDDGRTYTTSSPPVLDPGDNPSNQFVAVDEAKLVGLVTGTDLGLDVPVRAVAGAAKGELNVSLISVDGKTTLSSGRVAYDLAAAGQATLHAVLPVPSGVHEQPDWALFSVRIDDGAVNVLRVTSSLLRVVRPYEVRLEGPGTVSKDRSVSYRVVAEHPTTKQPLPNVPVELDVQKDGASVKTLTGKTSQTGEAVIEVALKDIGSYEVKAKATQSGTTTAVAHAMTVAEAGRKVLLTTDKPIYQPGQTVHLRALALAPPQNTPLAAVNAVFEVLDGKGNKVFHKELATDKYGVASTDFVIGPIVNEGTYKTSVTVNGSTTEKTVDVSHYALPKFGVDVKPGKTWYGPGEHVTGTLDARYFFGKPAGAADVVLEVVTFDIGETVHQRVVGKTDGTGAMSFDVTLPSSLVGLPLEQGNALVDLRVTVTDTAGQVVTKETALTVAQDPVRVTVVPESTILVPGIENRIQVFATDPLGGAIASASVVVNADGKTFDATTDAFGHAEVRWTPSSSTQTALTATVTPKAGSPVVRQFTFGGQEGDEHVLVRADKSVYDVGDTVTIEVLASGSSAHAYVDWLNEGQAVDMRTIDLSAGSGTFTMPLDGSLVGSNRVQAYIVDDGGNVVRAGRTLFVRGDSALDVTLTTDRATYTPGAPATLTFTVKDAEGNPAVAALGVQIVDEAVFSLVDAQPGLLRTYFELEDQYAKPTYEIDAPPIPLGDVLFDRTRSKDPNESQAGQVEAEATFAAIGGSSVSGIQEASWPAVVAQVKTLLSPFYADEKKVLITAIEPTIQAEVETLGQEGCSATAYYCPSLQSDFMSALVQRLKGKLPTSSDFWGRPFTLQIGSGYPYLVQFGTSGPDEQPGTSDDDVLTIQPSDLGVSVWGPGFADGGAVFNGGFPVPGAGGGVLGAGGAAAVEGPAAGPPVDDGTGSGTAPRVRRSFPETLYVNPEVITGPDGTAQVQVGLADSITQWRVSSLAHTLGGKLGGGQGGVTVFQDFFVDVDFPASLTRGDQVEFPIAVYNYLTTPQTVHLSLDPGTWYTATGPTTLDVALAAGEVQGVRFPVQVKEVGQKTLTVRAVGTAASDAVARTVTVLPDGRAFPEVHSGSLAPGSVTETVVFPATAIAGSQKLYVDVFPGYLSQVVQGMDSLLQVPNGCFEQTTSTTWPNVLALDYMQSTKQVTPDVQMKAESYINAGYQRLLTFEHPGGGYSWFGTQDPAPYLSVTALGVMEFADMAKVHPVDQAMVDRTTSWLVAQQQADGSWPGDQSEFFSIQTSGVRNTAFVVWALASAGYTGSELGRGLSYVKAQYDKETPDPYTLGLVANAAIVAAPSDAFGGQILAQLDGMKQTDGTKVFWDTAGTQTNFYGSGNDGAVSTTGIVTHAMLSAGGYAADVQGALEYLAAAKDPNGNFGSTQATVWTLRSLVLAATKGTETATGTLQVSVDGAPFSSVSLTKAESDVMTTVDLSTLATTGSHDVTLAFAGTGKLSYSVNATHNLPWADVPPDTGPLAVSVAYDKTTLQVDETALATVTVSNTTASIENMILVTVGIPPGFQIATADLDAYKTSGGLSQYELTEKQLTLYVTSLPASGAATFSYHLVATMPIVADDGGAQAFLYYEPEKKVAASGRSITVTGG